MESSWRIVPALIAVSREKTDMWKLRAEWIVGPREIAETPQVCPCGKTGIKEICHITNRETGVELEIGNCCVLFLADRGLCARCGIYETLSHSAHYCPACAYNRKDKPSGVVEKGRPRYGEPIIGLSYKEAYHRNPTYARYIHDTPSQWVWNDKHYLAFLRRHFKENGFVRQKRMTSSLDTKTVECVSPEA